MPSTLTLALSALLSSASSWAWGWGSSRRCEHNTWVDSAAMGIALIGVSMPIFWMGLLLIFVFSVTLNWFPAMGQGSLNRLVLPALALGLLSASTLARMVRSSMLNEMNQDYMRTAQAKGLRNTPSSPATRCGTR